MSIDNQILVQFLLIMSEMGPAQIHGHPSQLAEEWSQACVMTTLE